MNTNEFRKELVKIMPGYKWTVRRPNKYLPRYLEAIGIQTSGFNRLSTLQVIRSEKESGVTYEVKSSGYGLRSPWLSEYTDTTLARALRGLQGHYEYMSGEYAAHAGALQNAREKKESKNG